MFDRILDWTFDQNHKEGNASCWSDEGSGFSEAFKGFARHEVLPRFRTDLSIDWPFVFYFMRPDGRSSAAPVSSSAQKKKHLIEADPLAASIKCGERPLRGGSGGALHPQPKFGGSPQPKLEVKWIFLEFFWKKISKKCISPLIFWISNRKSRC